MVKMIFLRPHFVEKIWGGTKFRDEFGFELNSDSIGECWAISAHENGDCLIENDEFKGYTLSKLYNEKPELFGRNTKEVFPLLVKILDANDDLSVQVHPDDKYAKRVEKQLGKTECWYILDCDDDADIVMGHKARTREEVELLVKDGKWDEFINIRPIKKGDFFYVEPGTVHAIRKNTLIYELQQSSDVTYRLYDYGRMENGKPRELHIDKSIDVITAPQLFEDNPGANDSDFVSLVESEHFALAIAQCKDRMKFEFDDNYLLITVIEGSGIINNVAIKKGDSIILTYGNTDFELEGNITIMIASE